jgi:hypothetical protein
MSEVRTQPVADTAVLAAHVTLARHEGPAPASPDRPPYPGMRAFERDESDLFFGREDSIDLMVDRLAATHFLAVLGASGSGKSSLVKSGLIRALRRGEHPGASHRWKVAEMRPEAEPLQNLAKALLAATLSEPADQVEIDVLDGLLRLAPEALVAWMDGGGCPEGWNLLILVDQFEELFRYKDYAKREERDAFVRLLLKSAVEPAGRISVVLTMRSEYLDACSLMPDLSRRIGEGLFLTSQMTLDGVREAIERPARRLGFTVEPDLVDKLLDDLGQYAPWDRAGTSDEAEQLARQADQLPLLQHVLNRMWRLQHEAGGDVVLRLADYTGLGGIEGAITQHATEVVDGLKARFGDHTPDYVGRVFRALVTGPSLSLAVRRLRSIRQLADETGLPPDVVREVVAAFAAPACGFLRVSKPEAGDEARVDVAHESLIRKWKSLTGWFSLEVTEGVNWTRLTHAAAPKTDMVTLPFSQAQIGAYRAWWKGRKPTVKWTERYGGQHETVKRYLTKAHRLQIAVQIAAAALVVVAAGGAFDTYRMHEQKHDLQERQRQDELARRQEIQEMKAEADYQDVLVGATLKATRACTLRWQTTDEIKLRGCVDDLVAADMRGLAAKIAPLGGTGCPPGSRPSKPAANGLVTCSKP